MQSIWGMIKGRSGAAESGRKRRHSSMGDLKFLAGFSTENGHRQRRQQPERSVRRQQDLLGDIPTDALCYLLSFLDPRQLALMSCLSKAWKARMENSYQVQALWKFFFLQGWVGQGAFDRAEMDWIWKTCLPDMIQNRDGSFDLGPAKKYFLESKQTQLTLTLFEVEQCVQLKGWRGLVQALCERNCVECGTSTTFFSSLAIARVCVNCWCTKPRFRLCTVMEAENPPVLTDKNLHGASGGPLEAEKWPPWLTVRSIAAEVPELGAGSLGNRGDSSQDMVRVVLEPQGTHSISFFSQLFSFGGKSSVLTSHQRRGQLSKPKYGFHSITGLYYYRTDPDIIIVEDAEKARREWRQFQYSRDFWESRLFSMEAEPPQAAKSGGFSAAGRAPLHPRPPSEPLHGRPSPDIDQVRRDSPIAPGRNPPKFVTGFRQALSMAAAGSTILIRKDILIQQSFPDNPLFVQKPIRIVGDSLPMSADTFEKGVTPNALDPAIRAPPDPNEEFKHAGPPVEASSRRSSSSRQRNRKWQSMPNFPTDGISEQTLDSGPRDCASQFPRRKKAKMIPHHVAWDPPQHSRATGIPSTNTARLSPPLIADGKYTLHLPRSSLCLLTSCRLENLCVVSGWNFEAARFSITAPTRHFPAPGEGLQAIPRPPAHSNDSGSSVRMTDDDDSSDGYEFARFSDLESEGAIMEEWSDSEMSQDPTPDEMAFSFLRYEDSYRNPFNRHYYGTVASLLIRNCITPPEPEMAYPAVQLSLQVVALKHRVPVGQVCILGCEIIGNHGTGVLVQGGRLLLKDNRIHYCAYAGVCALALSPHLYLPILLGNRICRTGTWPYQCEPGQDAPQFLELNCFHDNELMLRAS